MADVRKAGEKLVFATAHRIEPEDIDIAAEGQPTDIRSADYCVDKLSYVDDEGATKRQAHTPMTKGQFSRGWVPVNHLDAQELTSVG